MCSIPMLCFPGQGSVLCTNMYWYLSRYLGRKSLLTCCSNASLPTARRLPSTRSLRGSVPEPMALGARSTYARGDVPTGLRTASHTDCMEKNGMRSERY